MMMSGQKQPKPSAKPPEDGAEILIAEDSPTQAEQMRHIVAKHGYTARVAANGREALESARQCRPALIISDILMPEMDGYGLCRAIKAEETTKDIPVILITALSDAQEIFRGLECGADNFIRKPYDERYLISRIEDLLMNLELRKQQKMPAGIEIQMGGRKHLITAERQQMLDLLISTFEQAALINDELKAREVELARSNQLLNGLYRLAESLNKAVSEQEVGEVALEGALGLPGIQAGWIVLREGESGFRLLATRSLPPALLAPGAMEGDCLCRRRLLSGELDSVTNILECERLCQSHGDTRGLLYHASVPLWSGDKTIGLLNLSGSDLGLFKDDELKLLFGVGNQVALALERARLLEHLEQLVKERTAALTAEILERTRIEKEQAKLLAIIDATPDLVATVDLAGNLLYCNQSARLIGFNPGQDVSALGILESHPEWSAQPLWGKGVPGAIEKGSWTGEASFQRPDGGVTPLSQVVIAHKGDSGEVEYLSTVARDISAVKANEQRIMRLNRVYSVLSGINTAILRTRSRQELFDTACRIAVEQGGFRMAWIGLLDAGRAEVNPVAYVGLDEGYLNQIRLNAQEDSSDCCLLLAQAMLQQTPMVCNDIANDAQMMRWREESLRRGYRSLAVFPLQVGAEVIGVLALYASETDFFDTEELKLLTEIAGDLSFALDHLEKEQRLNYLAYYDVLTGLPNRALFSDRLNQHLLAAKESSSLALLFIDVERFRVINETLGRQGGDALIKEVAERLRCAGMDANFLAYTGAGSFALALTYLQDEADAVHILEGQILETLGRPFMAGNEELRISAKTGIAIYPDDGGDAETLLRNAEAALKKAKLSGDKYLFYTPELNARVAEQLKLDTKLRRAVEEKQFVLHYQPKVGLDGGRIIGMEALIRWNDPATGLVPPMKFIPHLEETGLILDVGQWALEQAMADFAKWSEAGLAPPRIAVNVSPIQLRQKGFLHGVESALGGLADGGHRLELEITESIIMQDIQSNIEKLKLIRAMGVEVAIDDFGTGYSSLGYIAKLPVNTLKIDRAFIINMTSSADDLSIVSAIISLARSLNLKVVAEGVETKEQANLLKLLKCDEIQGWLFSKAVPAEQMGQLLKEEKSLQL